MKHAKAKKIEVNLSNDKNRNIVLSIIDNGKGFDLKKVKKNKISGNGLGNMQTRVRLLNGTFKIESESNKGTSIFVLIPLFKEN